MLLTLEDGIRICREMEAVLAPLGYHTALTGSLLYKGQSTKDADIIVYPHQVSEQLAPVIILEKLGVFVTSLQNEASCKDKLVAVTEYKGARVDIFFLERNGNATNGETFMGLPEVEDIPF
jgi:hypothetical protein